MTSIVVLGALLLIPSCSHRERQRELLERAGKSEREQAGPPPGANEPLTLENSAVSITFERAEAGIAGMTNLVLTVENRSDHVLKSVTGQVVIMTTSNASGIQLGFEIPVRIPAHQSIEYAMPAERSPADQESRWSESDRVTGATFRVERVVSE